MKAKKLIYLEKILGLMAAAVLKRRNPNIVAITGSVGKTSAKSAIFQVLSSKFSVRENQKNYNNEIGIPLTIIGAESGGRNILKWLWVFLKWLWAVTVENYPEILVLELGVDRPGDMTYFMSFIHPQVGVVTNVSSSHLEYFSTLEKIAKEKGALIKSLKSSSFAILNGDDELVAQMESSTKAHVLMFGLDQDLALSASKPAYSYQTGKPDGISFKLNYDGKNIPIRLKHILGEHYVYAALAGVAVGIAFKLNLVEIAQALEELKAPIGRVNLLPGINGSYIIDDTYNASPASTVAALETLAKLESQRKIAVLGDMLELGAQSEMGHRQVGRKVFETQIDSLVVMGDRMNDAVRELIALGFPSSKIMNFKDHSAAVAVLKNLLKEGDFVLVKGSQGMRMEKIVEGILANPDDGEKLLCRQTRHWKKIPYKKP
jgi:UDP-N-acetylmuramoyl-tripeptide--D-alanyl-D-alanine ligase